MRKKIVAMVLCLALFSLTAVTLSASSPVTQNRLTLRSLIESSWNFVVSILPFLGTTDRTQPATQNNDTSKSLKVVRPTDQGAPVIRLGNND